MSFFARLRQSLQRSREDRALQRRAIGDELWARTLEHYADNIGCVGWSLTDDQFTRLTTVSAKPPVYPYDLLRNFVR